MYLKEQVLSRICYSDESGETMVETLVSILITSLALLLLATAIGTAVNIIVASRKYMNAYYRGEDALVTGYKEGLGDEKELTISDPKNSSTLSTIEVLVYENDDTGLVFYERKNDVSG